ncbi:site-specific integrase [Candidatus Bathyarchaeota archaeon]|nr:MAG: site-specific integrase [Candidatus Bathyarchaeota archaeon]
MLRVAGPRDRALLGFLACTGMRIREVLHRKMTELVRHKGYASIVLQAGQTKARVKRIVFLTQEVVDWIDLYHKQPEVSGNQWIFPGETHRNSKSHDAPISYSAAHTAHS